MCIIFHEMLILCIGMKLVKNLLLLAALVVGFIFVKNKFFSHKEDATQTEQIAPDESATTTEQTAHENEAQTAEQQAAAAEPAPEAQVSEAPAEQPVTEEAPAAQQ